MVKSHRKKCYSQRRNETGTLLLCKNLILSSLNNEVWIAAQAKCRKESLVKAENCKAGKIFTAIFCEISLKIYGNMNVSKYSQEMLSYYRDLNYFTFTYLEIHSGVWHLYAHKSLAHRVFFGFVLLFL